MSKLFSPLFLAALMLPAAALAQAAPAAPSGTKVGIINMQTAIVATNEGQRDFEALAKKFEPKRTELKGISDDLDSMKKQLDTQGSKLNDETRSDLVKKIEAKRQRGCAERAPGSAERNRTEDRPEDGPGDWQICQREQPGHDPRRHPRLAGRRTDLGQ
jgi:Skp family chaperone for outer membrane proteins